MCRSIRLPRQQRPKNTEDKPVFGPATTPGSPEAKSLRRDDGPDQADTRVVDASNDVITLSADWPACSSHEPHQATALRRSRTEASPGEWMTQKGIDSSRPVTEASRAKLSEAHERSHHRFRRINRHSPRNGFTAYSVLSPASEFLLSPSLAD